MFVFWERAFGNVKLPKEKRTLDLIPSFTMP